MASRAEVEVTITKAKDLKNVNWRHGSLKAYAVLWVDPNNKCTTRVDEEGDTCPYWDQTLVIPLNAPIEDSYLYIDIVHARAKEGTKPLIGSARLSLSKALDDAGSERKLELKRPSGRPHGKVEVKVVVKQPRYRAPDPYYAPAYGVRDYAAPPQYGNQYGAPPQGQYPGGPPVGGYPYGGPQYGQPAYGQQSYGQPVYGQQSYGHVEEKKSSKYGMGTGLAVGAAAGLLGGLAIAEGIDYVEDEIAENAAEKVEDDQEYDDYE